jgi:hypothetical protein
MGKSAYMSIVMRVMEVMLPVLCGGVFFIKLSIVYNIIAILAMVTGLITTRCRKHRHIIGVVDNLRINDAIARWLVKSVDKPDINVMFRDSGAQEVKDLF